MVSSMYFRFKTAYFPTLIDFCAFAYVPSDGVVNRYAVLCSSGFVDTAVFSHSGRMSIRI